MGKRTKYQVLVDRVMGLAPSEMRRFVDELAAHEDGDYVIELLKRAIASRRGRQLQLLPEPPKVGLVEEIECAAEVLGYGMENSPAPEITAQDLDLECAGGPEEFKPQRSRAFSPAPDELERPAPPVPPAPPKPRREVKRSLL